MPKLDKRLSSPAKGGSFAADDGKPNTHTV